MRNLLPLICFLGSAVLWSRAQSAPPSLTTAQAQELIQRALATESRAALDLSHASHPMCYRLRKTSPRLSSTKEIIETRDGNVARLLSIDDQPLSADSEQQEQARLQSLIDNPSLQQHRKRSEDIDAARAILVLRVLPTAFLYQYSGIASSPNGMVAKFTFRPNPQFNPPDIETGILTAMAGEVWIDLVHERVVRLVGSLQTNKDFGLGVLGELDKGGYVDILQAEVGDHQWRITCLKLVMNGRVFFKSKNSSSDQKYTDFTPLPPDLTYRQAIEMLRTKSWPTTAGSH